MKKYRDFNFFKEYRFKKNKENIVHIIIFVFMIMYTGTTYIKSYSLYNKYKIYETINNNSEINVLNIIKSKISYDQIKAIYNQNNLVQLDEVYSNENYIYIKGTSNNLNLISQYSKKLQSTDLFKIVFIDNIKVVQPNNMNQFEIKCTLKEKNI